MIIIREKKRAAGFRFAPKSVLTFHATLKQEKKAFVCRTYACWHPHNMSTGTDHHCPVRGRVVLVRGAMEATAIDDKTTTV